VSLDSAAIDRIVAGVLTQIGGGAARAEGKQITETPRRGDKPDDRREDAVAAATLTERVITAGVLEALAATTTIVTVGPKAIVTPGAWDVVRERGLDIRRGAAPPAAALTINPQPSTINSALLIVVHHTDAVARLYADLQGAWRREFLGCPDDAAKLAIGELSRGGAPAAVILAEQSHRAACLANRHESVKAAVVRDAAEVAAVRQQIRVNVWCVNPRPMSWFELSRLFRALAGPR